MNEMVERVARKYAEITLRDSHPESSDEIIKNAVSVCCGDPKLIRFARELITAMREPTEEMENAARMKWGYQDVNAGFDEIWHAMIDETLK